MPIGSVDTNLTVAPPNIQSPLDQAARVLSLKTMLAQQQLQPGQLQMQQQQIQAEQMANRQRQMDLEDQSTIRQAYMDAGGDMDKFQQLVTKRGVQPKNMLAVNNSILEMKKNVAGLDETQAKVAAAHGAAVASEAQGLLNIKGPDDASTQAARAAAWPQAVDRLAATGQINAAQVQQFKANPVLDDNGLKMLVAHGTTADKQASMQSQALQAQARKQMADASQKRADVESARWETERGGAEAQALQRQLSTAAQTMGSQKMDPTEYARQRGQLPYAVAKLLPTEEDYAADPEGARQTINQLGMTAQQRATAATQAAAHAETERHNLAEESKPTATQATQQEKQHVMQLAQRAMNDSRSGGGASYDDAIKNLQNPGNYQNDEMDNYREQVIAQLNAWKLAGMKPDQMAASTAAAKARVNKASGDWRSRVGGAPAPPTTPAAAPAGVPAGVPAAPKPVTPTAKPPQKPAQQPAQKFTEAQVRQRAVAAGKDPDAVVAAAKAKGLL